MSPLRSTFQFLALALCLGAALAFADRALLQQPSALDVAKREPVATQGSIEFSAQYTSPAGLTSILYTSADAFRLPIIETAYTPAYALAAPLRPQAQAPAPAPAQRLRQTERASAKVLAFIPPPKQRPIQPSNTANTGSNADLAQSQDLLFVASTDTRTAPRTRQTLALNQSGYDALGTGDTKAASSRFTQSLGLDPNQPNILAQLGYVYKAQGQFRNAAEMFQLATALSPSTGGQPGIARETTSLNRALRLSGYTIWRQDSQREADISFGPSLAQSQSGLGATYRLPVDGWASQHDLAVYTRLLWAYDPMSFRLDETSFQSGIGVQVRPVSGLNLVAAAERLVAVGDQSRNDWLLRASYSAGQGYAPMGRERTWLHWSVYSDVAVIDPADPDVQITGEGRIGVGQRPFEASSLSVIPFAGISANYQDAAGIGTSLVEAGAGVWMRYWPGGADLPDPLRALDMRIEYRGKVGGDSASTSGLRLTLGVTY